MSFNKINFLSISINDTQSIIKALDTKMGFLIALLSLPFTNLHKIISHLYLFVQCGSTNATIVWSYVIIIIFTLLWLLAFYISVRGILAIGNPSNNVNNDLSANGSFYSGYLFRYSLKDGLIHNRSNIATKKLSEQIKLIPEAEENIIIELTYEQMKLAYIRDVKIHRLHSSFWILVYWLLTGFIIYFNNYYCSVNHLMKW